MARHFDNWLKAYLEFSATSSEAPLAFHFWTGVGTIAGALRSCVWVDEKTFKITPNFYLFLISPPGIATKSTTLNLGMRLLEKVPEIHFGPSSVTWQALMRAFQESIITVKWEEAGESLSRAASCLTVDVAELGTFLKIGTEGFIDNLVNWWDGKISDRPFIHRTLTGGSVSIENPWLNILGCTTPSWLQANFPEHMIGGGFTSRVLFVYGERKRQLIHRPSQHWRGREFEILEAKLVDDLKEMAKLRGSYTYTPDADAWMRDWYERHWTTVPSHMASVRYEGYRSRKQTHIVKIAMVLAASIGDALTLTPELLDEARQHLESAEASMTKVFESIGVADEAKYIREIVGYVKSFSSAFPDGIPTTKLWQLCYNIMSWRDFQAAALSAINAKLLVQVKIGTDALGRNSYALRLPRNEGER